LSVALAPAIPACAYFAGLIAAAPPEYRFAGGFRAKQCHQARDTGRVLAAKIRRNFYEAIAENVPSAYFALHL
jgi:hypothetical protein